MATYCLTIQYDGTRYNGWQKQGNTSNTIQEKLETLLGRLYDTPLEIAGSGRTDAGVHALGQTASFHIEKSKDKFSCEELTARLNQYLPEDIRILKTEQKEDRFHARLLAKSKVYEYRIDLGNVHDVFQRKYTLHLSEHIQARMNADANPALKSSCPALPVKGKNPPALKINAAPVFPAMKENTALDISAMQKAAEYLLGTHDFKSFCDNKRMKKSTVRTIYSIDFIQNGPFLTIRYCGNGFLYHMVRILTGTLLDMGLHLRDPKDTLSMLNGMDRALAGPSVPPQGLFLVEVSYHD